MAHKPTSENPSTSRPSGTPSNPRNLQILEPDAEANFDEGFAIHQKHKGDREAQLEALGEMIRRKQAERRSAAQANDSKGSSAPTKSKPAATPTASAKPPSPAKP